MTVTSTLFNGCDANRTVYVSVPPFSATCVDPALSLIVTPEESSSVTVTGSDGSDRLVV